MNSLHTRIVHCQVQLPEPSMLRVGLQGVGQARMPDPRLPAPHITGFSLNLRSHNIAVHLPPRPKPCSDSSAEASHSPKTTPGDKCNDLLDGARNPACRRPRPAASVLGLLDPIRPGRSGITDLLFYSILQLFFLAPIDEPIRIRLASAQHRFYLPPRPSHVLHSSTDCTVTASMPPLRRTSATTCYVHSPFSAFFPDLYVLSFFQATL